ncbi:MAG: hypothetical protein DDT24_00719 [Chloroflexi bacterium]|nr:hypothetical protein [Chloroflexota bacterium]MBT9166150.1 hypothetical protein [Chloroflexota bacterium]
MQTVDTNNWYYKAHVYPEMVPLLVIQVEGGGHE